VAVQSVRQLAALGSAVLLDVLILVLSGVLIAVVVIGGGVWTIDGLRLSVRSVANPLVFLCVALLLRWFLRSIPFLGWRAFPLHDVDDRALWACRRAGALVTGLSPVRAARWISGIIILVTLAKLANAYFYPGFFSGDDVEIHEMTFTRLFQVDWPIWNLRSPFYPFVFIYPGQAGLVALGVTDTATLVLVGRVVVAIVSALAIWLTYLTGWRLGGPAVALFAGAMLAMSRLHVTFGGSELPRPVATVFVVAAFLVILSNRVTLVRAAAAGCLLGVAASCRFSEMVFMLPALAQLVLSHRYREAAIAICGFTVTCGLILGLGDLLFWDSPFFSFANVFDYTVVYQMSSRGYEPFYYYLSALHAWTSVPVLLLALYALKKGNWQVGLWWLIPIALLSLLPHKEPRYLLPVVPFLALSAAQGLDHLLTTELVVSGRLWGFRKEAVALVLAVACVAAVVFEVGGWRFRKSDDGIRVAREITARGCHGAVAVEQLWRAGGRLYFRTCREVRDLEDGVGADLAKLAGLAAEPDIEWLVLRSPAVEATQQSLREAGFEREPMAAIAEYMVFRRVLSRNTGS
jgi:hypothetical protein